MRTIIVTLFCSLLLFTGFAAARTPEYLPGRLILQLADDAVVTVDKTGNGVTCGLADLDRLLSDHGVRTMDQLYAGVRNPNKAGTNLLQIYTVDFPADLDLDAMAAKFSGAASIKQVWKDELQFASYFPNDSHFGAQWHLRASNMGGKDIRALGGWAESLGDSNVIIAIVDSGVDWNHPDLGGTHPDKINGAVYTNWTEYNGTPGVDDDGNGKIDDIRGWDFISLSQSQGWPNEDMTVADNDPSDYESHGTACAGSAAAITNNGVGVAGVAPGCKILPVRAGYLPAGETLGVLPSSYASAGMIYAADIGAKLINCSWGPGSSFFSFAITYCTDAGAIVVQAAGNDNEDNPSWMQLNASVVEVAATADGDVRASFSNFGTWVDVAAPGVSITSTWYDRFTGTHVYSSVQGTSFSCPITCGAIALLWSAEPGLTRSQVLTKLYNSCDFIDDVNPGFEGDLGAGRINLLKALGDAFHKVPEEFDFAFDAFNSSATGDTIAIKAATPLTGPLVIPAKDIFVLGGWDNTFAGRDPVGTPTVITANVTNTALQVNGGAGPGLVIDGFACTGGGGKSFNGIPDSGNFGGGVLINGTSPTLRNIEVYGNTVGSALNFGGGGGIMLLNSDSVLENVRVHDNSGVYGPGIYVSGGAPTLSDCVIENNIAYANATVPRGGGLYVVNSDVTLSGTTISGHDGLDAGGGLYAIPGTGTVSVAMSHTAITGNFARSKGGGVYVGGGSLTMLGDLISGNGPAAGATFMSGGGVCVENATAAFDSVSITNNSSQTGGGLTHTNGASLDLTNSLIAANTAVYFAGAVSLQTITTGTFAGNTVSANGSGSSAGGINMTSAYLSVSNNIVAFNTGSAASSNGFTVSGGSTAFACNDVFGNDGAQFGGIADPTGNNGNIAEDPKFCDAGAADYSIMDTSPCHVDNAGACGQIGAFGQGCATGTGVQDETGPGAVPLVFAVEPNFPNPFNPSTTIRFALPAQGQVSVRIYDIAGRLVRTLVDEVLDAAVHEIQWAGADDRGHQVSSGVYFYRVIAGDHDVVERMALVK